MGKALLAGLLLFSAHASALLFRGPSTGGGGFVVWCPDRPRSLESVELVDLYEARSLFRYQLARPSGVLAHDYAAAVRRMHAYQGYSRSISDDVILDHLSAFFRSTRFIEDESLLPATDDLGIRPSTPLHCQIRQIAYFDDKTSTIMIVKSLWDKMDSLNQAALIQHEVSYRTFRALYDFTSRYSRRMVAHAYAVSGPLAVTDGLDAGSLRFLTDGPNVTEFFATPMTGKREIVRLQFTTLEGRPILSKTWVDLPHELRQFDSQCRASRPDTNQVFSLPIQGAMLDGDVLRYTYRTGETVKFELVRGGEVISQSEINTRWGCNGIAAE